MDQESKRTQHDNVNIVEEYYFAIKKDLEALGIKKGDKLLIHSSYKSMKMKGYCADTFFAALKDTVGYDGLLMFPTFTYDVVNEENPFFDVEKTFSTHVGILPELFRHTDGVIRSVHPTHSLAVWGKDAASYVKDHQKDNVCVGENSPIFKLKDNGGKILMIGCGIAHNTLIHGVECFVKAPYAFTVDYTVAPYKREYTVRDAYGVETKINFFHEFTEAIGWYQAFYKLLEVMKITEGKVLEAQSFIMDAKEVWDTVIEKMKEDPYFFMSRQP